jgi:hypothetical protein
MFIVLTKSSSPKDNVYSLPYCHPTKQNVRVKLSINQNIVMGYNIKQTFNFLIHITILLLVAKRGYGEGGSQFCNH